MTSSVHKLPEQSLRMIKIKIHVNQLWHLAAKDFSILFLNIKALKTFSWWYVLLGCCVICCVTCNVKKLFILFINLFYLLIY